MARLIPIALLLTLLALPARASNDGGQALFTSAWPQGVTRPWIGASYFANRLQDWRLTDGRVECVEGRPRFPVRTLHVLTRALSPDPGTIEVSVRTGPINASEAWTADAWSGFLIGAGGEEIDHRITALVHHHPAEDGGLLALVDGEGHVHLRDFSRRPDKGSGMWSLRGALEAGDVPTLEPAQRSGDGFGTAGSGPVRLRMFAQPFDHDSYVVTLTATRTDGTMLSEITVGSVDAEHLEGGLALASHRGPGNTGHWFRDWRASGSKLLVHNDRTFGPVHSVLYTVSDGTLKLTAQFPPLGEQDLRDASLEVGDADGNWQRIATEPIVAMSNTATFRIAPWDASRATPFRVRYDDTMYYGVVRAEPTGDEFVIGALTCQKTYTGVLRWNENGIWFPHADIAESVAKHDPDLLYFSGDQIYEGDLTPAIQRPLQTAMLDYHYKWLRFCWSFGDLTRNTPCICVPDDHDVYHGNLWGAGGKRAKAENGLTAQDSGGYKMPPEFVNAVHRTQVGHLPDPVDPAPAGEYTVYFTRLDYGGVSCAILADRQFKSAPAVVVPEGQVKNGWFQNLDFDPATQADVPGAVLLGERQLAFLADWATDWSNDAWMKVALSQTIFTNLATLPKDARSGSVIPSLPLLPPGEEPDGYVRAADCDSNAWPQTGRQRAVRELRRACAIHLAGDQHLGSTLQYGIDAHRDGSFAFCVPSISNTWPRRWFPDTPGEHRAPGAPSYTGDFYDGFGNRMTVYAVANPATYGQEPRRLHDLAPGYGIVRLDRNTRRVIFECWPRWIDPEAPDAHQYAGWPVEIHQLDNAGANRADVAWLPTLHVRGCEDPIVQVYDAEGELLYGVRIQGQAVQPRATGPGPFEIRAIHPETGAVRTKRHPGAARDDLAGIAIIQF